jgi:tRNA-specific 2-thiouridylase
VSRVAVGMSGGVDSAVSALLLKQQGFDVIGVFMNNWEEKDEHGVCTSAVDWNDVQDTCEVIGIPCYSINFSREYEDRVFSHFLSEYRSGRTPNPDVLCNREIKFKAFLDYAVKIGAEKMATGHFVQRDGQGRLYKGKDRGKDQSYFLYMLKEAQLRMSLFPVGDLQKAEVRALAGKAGLPVSTKKDSTGICFIGERRFREFLKQYIPAQAGDILSVSGKKIGRHEGAMYYTIGQRHGLGIGGAGDGRSWFVVDKDTKNNLLIAAQGEDHPLLYTLGAALNQVTWIGEPPCGEGEGCAVSVKLRYRQADQEARFSWQGEEATLRFLKPQRAVTPGQSAVLYRDEQCLGGGIIIEALRE